MKKVYCRDEQEKLRLQNVYPDAEARWFIMPISIESRDKPMVCLNDESLDECLVGEQHIGGGRKIMPEEPEPEITEQREPLQEE